MQGLVKPAVSFLVQSHHELQKKKESSKEVIHYSKGNPLSMHPQISLILDQTPSPVTYPHVIEVPKALKI